MFSRFLYRLNNVSFDPRLRTPWSQRQQFLNHVPGSVPRAEVFRGKIFARDLAQMLTLGHGRTQWKPPIIRTSAQDGSGIEELVRAIDAHAEWSRTSGELETRRAGAARQEVEALLREALVKRLESRVGSERVADAVKRVADRELDPYRAVEELLDQ